MSDTMTDMKFVYADLLTPSQLMEGDLINIDNDIVEVVSVVDDATGDNYTVTHRNEYGEEGIAGPGRNVPIVQLRGFDIFPNFC